MVRSHRTHTEEFYEVEDREWTATAARAQARRWEQVYNTVRPHQSLGYRPPREFLEEHGWLPARRARSAPGPIALVTR